MKKVISVMLAMLICVSLVATAFAAEGVFTPSVTAKPAPEIVAKDEAAGAPVVEVVDTQEATVQTFEVVHVEVTPVSEKDEEHVDEEVTAVLTEVYEKLSADDVKLAEVMPALEEIVKEAAAADATLANFDVNELVVKDLFHVAVSEELEKVLEVEGNTLKLTLDAKVTPGQFIIVMVLVDGEWIPVEFEINEDGTITCALEVVGVIAILTKV